MYSNLKKGLFLVTFSGAAMLLPVTAKAADTQSELPSVGIEEVLDHCYSSGKEIEIEKYLVPTKKGEYLDMAFADVETFLYIRSEPTTESEWVGKLYPDDAAKIMGPVDEWTKVQSGSVTGYVYSKYITVGKKAEEKAQKIVKKKQEKRLEKKKIEKENPEKEEVLEKPEQIFEYAESKEEEEARLEKEAEEARRREEEARKKAEEEAKEKAGSGQAIVDYACQFIGNPYVWGGTSLTNGADCSGFVQSVYKHFGVSLPRTSGQMRGAGTGVSYSEAIPGDVICYDGHVGIYMGDGQIVNAINRSKGIGVLSATYANIITVRRIL
ncbi:C40 family peptidase [Lachnospiraceae bacterium MD308]|nr:C40 family peptidase [Lachnospiraceae bacterium MD308]